MQVTTVVQPFDPDSADKHKFMVQTMFAPPDFTQDQLDMVVSMCVGGVEVGVGRRMSPVLPALLIATMYLH